MANIFGLDLSVVRVIVYMLRACWNLKENLTALIKSTKKERLSTNYNQGKKTMVKMII